MSFRRFAWSFCHTSQVDEQLIAYETQVVPTPSRLSWQPLLSQSTNVNFRNGTRAPLLATAGSLDRAVDASMIRWNYRKYRRSEAVTELMEFPDRTHWLIAPSGWEEIADAVLSWAEHHKKPAQRESAEPVSADR